MQRPDSEHSQQPAILGGKPVRPSGPPDWPCDEPTVAEALHSALADGSWGRYHGPHCDALADGLAEYHGVKHVLLCSSGTAAVELALRGLRVSDGDEVVMSAYDFKANFQNVVLLDATPVLVDVRPDDWNIDVAKIEPAITLNTKAILVSHLHGGVVDMPALMELARRRNVPVVEDACQAHGADVYGHKAGATGDVGVLSFGGSKLMTAGRGGAVLSNADEVVQRIRLYTGRGNESYPLSELQAAVLLPQLKALDERNEKRLDNVNALRSLLAARTGLVPFAQPADCAPAFYKLGVQYDAAAFENLPRDRFADAMQAEGIALSPGFRPLDAIHSRRRFRIAGKLTTAAETDARVLTLHHPVLLEDEALMEQIATALDRIKASATMIADAK